MAYLVQRAASRLYFLRVAGVHMKAPKRESATTWNPAGLSEPEDPQVTCEAIAERRGVP